MTDLTKFSQALRKSAPSATLNRQQTADAFHNLSGFLSVLIRVNDREQLIPTKNNGRRYEN